LVKSTNQQTAARKTRGQTKEQIQPLVIMGFWDSMDLLVRRVGTKNANNQKQYITT